MSTEYTQKELYAQMQKVSTDGSLSIDEFASIVYDPRYPKYLFEKGHQFIIDWRNGQARLKELAKLLLPHWEEQLRLKQIGEHAEILKIAEQIKELEQEFDELNEKYGGR